MKIIPPLNLPIKFGYLSTLLIFITVNYNALAQQREIDSLKKILSHTKDDTSRVIVLNKLALDYYTTNLDDLKVYGNQALRLARRLKYAQGEAVAYKNLGLGYLAADANPMALEYFDKALKIFTGLHDNLNSARVLNNIGYYYSVIKDHQQELNYLLQAFDAAEGSNNMQVEAAITGNVGNSYEALNQLERAHDYYSEQLVMAQTYNLADALVISNANLASVSLKEKRYAQAIDYCNKVLAMSKRSDNFKPRDLANIYIIQGKIYLQLKNYPKARQAFTQSVAIAQRLGNSEYLSQNYYNLHLLDSLKGDYRSALKNYHQYVVLNDSLINVNKNRVVALYQIKFDSQKRVAENQQLKISEGKSEAVIHKQRTTQVILLIGLVFICGGAVYLFHINNLAKSKNKIINDQNRILENNNLVKDKLFSVISHDLRSPITQVVGLLNLWEEGEMSNDEISTLIPSVKSSTLHTLELIDNLLIWSKSQMQGFHFNPLPFDLHQLTAQNLKNLEGLIRKKAIAVDNGIEPGTMAYADQEMMKIVLRNLISNAIKFTADKGSIRINSTVKDGETIICVEDNGIGISESDQHKIFSFTTHTTLGTSNEKGTGIGLKICRDFIELNQGSIWVESKQNVGSKFYVSMPVNTIIP